LEFGRLYADRRREILRRIKLAPISVISGDSSAAMISSSSPTRDGAVLEDDRQDRVVPMTSRI
jgi:hypothetical protein